ncbi:MAG TPA: DUF4469 domain-containing protein [Bacteroidales bacterium]|nr:DUF4469 domain-containing protein [Bacteroidales bacterium]
MATTEKSKVIVELYDLTFTERKDDRFGRVVTTKSLTEDDLVNIAVSRRTDLNANTLKAGMQLLKDVAIEELANGASIRFGLAYFHLTVNGVFIGDNAKWDPSKHSLVIDAAPVSEIREAVRLTEVDVRGMAASGMAINAVTDVSSGKVNNTLTPGGGVNLLGTRIKIEGDAAGVGISLINQSTQAATAIPKTSLLVNEPSKVTFVVPSGLAKGDYKLSITTQFSASQKPLKEARTYTFDYILNVA